MERFTIFRSQYECFKRCTPEIRLELSDAMFAYAFEGKDPEFKNPMSEAVWLAMLPVINTSLRQSQNGSKSKKKQDNGKDKDVALEPTKESDEEIDNTPSFKVEYLKVKSLWDSICGSSFGMIHKLTDSRKQKIRIRALEIEKSGAEYLTTFEQIFNIMANSRFMSGNNNRGWKPTFDWIIENDKNYVKVLEGNYNNNTEQYGSRRLSEHAAEESFYNQQSRIATSMLLQDGDCGLVGEAQDD